MNERSESTQRSTEEKAVIKPFGASKPAHPTVEIRYSTGPGPVATTKVFHTGLTKREYFAAMTMQSVRAVNPACSSQEVAQSAVADADALLKELAK